MDSQQANEGIENGGDVKDYSSIDLFSNMIY